MVAPVVPLVQVPFGQGVQAEGELGIWFAAQGVHVDAPSEDTWPAVQLRQAVALVPLANLPGSQRRHTDIPIESVYLPATQFRLQS